MKKRGIALITLIISVTSAVAIAASLGIILMCVHMPNDNGAPDIDTGVFRVDNEYVPNDNIDVSLEEVFGSRDVVVTISEMTEKQADESNALCFLPYSRCVKIEVDGVEVPIRISKVNTYDHGVFGIEFFRESEKIQLLLSCGSGPIRMSTYGAQASNYFARFVKDGAA